jgi:hypothetical protein
MSAAPPAIIDHLEATVHEWNAAPTPFVWGSPHAVRRTRACPRCYDLGGSGARTLRLIGRRSPLTEQWRYSYRTTH